MATAEAASAALGPRYAPEDPTLPKPWKGLIDGSTGLLYYWNPETNITQYEKPATVPPPFPSGPSPVASTPKLTPIPVAHSMPPSSVMAQHGQQLPQASQYQGQQVSHLAQQHGQTMPQQQSPLVSHVTQQPPSQVAQAGQQQNSMPVQSMQQQGFEQVRQQMMQPQGQQMPQQSSQQSHHQMPSQAMQSQHFGQGASQDHGSHMVQPQAQFSQQNLHFMSYQQNMFSAGHQNSQHIQHIHGQPFENQQDFKTTIPKMDEVDFKNGTQVGFSPSQYQHKSALSVQNNQNHPPGINSVQGSHGSVSTGQLQEFGGLSGGMQQSPSAMQSQQGSADLVSRHGPTFRSQMGPGMMHSQPSNVHPVGPKMGHEDNLSGRGGNEYYYNSSKEMPAMGPLQPNIAPIPMPRNQQDMRISSAPYHNSMPSGNGLSGIPGHAMNNIFSPPVARPPPLSSNSVMRPSFIGSSDVTDLSPAEIYCQQHEVTATGDNIPPPFMTFDAAGFPPEILREIYSAGFSTPTPIQAQTWPVAFQGRDIVAIAKTGSGKTLGYLIPAFILLRQRRNNPLNGPTVLVLAPTRELATQIQDEAIKFGRSSRISCTCLYGGASKAVQLKELDRGADIVVATPGRLNDILEMKKIDFRQVSLLVLDEADRMLDMGFEPQIRKIVNEIPPRRQTLMYTATWPKEVRKIAGDLLVNPVQVNIGSIELAANKAITQYVEVVPQMEKQRRLEQILRSQERGSKIIIFCSTKRLCDQLARSIGRNFGAAAIHGDKSQGERDWVLNQFRTGKSPVLVATDVAARGLDIKDIRVVINYDFPTGIEDYVHRIGRTGRAGATGVSYTFFSEQDAKHAGDLIKVLEGANQHVPPELQQMASRGSQNIGRERSGMSRFDSGGSVAGRWDAHGRGGMRDGGFSGRGGMRDGGLGGRGGMRDDGFGNHGGMREGGFGGRGGMRDGAFVHGGRGDFFSGRGNRGRGPGGPRGGHVGWGRGERGPQDRYNMDGRGRGRGRGRFDNRRDVGYRNRGRSYSRSPEKVRTWDYSRSRSTSRSSRSRSRSRSWSRGRSRSRSWSRGRSRSYSRSRSRSRSYSRGRRSRSYSRSRSPSYDRHDRSKQPNNDQEDPRVSEAEASDPRKSAMSPGSQVGNSYSGTEHADLPPIVGNTEPDNPAAVVEPGLQSASDVS